MKYVLRYLVLATAMGFLIFSCSEEPELLQAPPSGPLTSVLNGNETLGDPVGLTLASGSGFVSAGKGLFPNLDGAIAFTVPAGVTVKQVILYWEGQHYTASGDGSITVNGNSVTGALIGGPNFFYAPYSSSTYRADITGLGLVTTGANTLNITDMDFVDKNSGIGALVIYEELGAPVSTIMLKDGNDLAWRDFPEPRKSCVPQEFTFSASTAARQAKAAFFIGSIMAARPSILRWWIDGVEQPRVCDAFSNPNDGAEWAEVVVDFTVPAGATAVKFQPVSDVCPTSPYYPSGNPQSFAWVGAALSIETPEAPVASIGDYVWLDENQDGIQDPSEEGIADVTVYLFECGNMDPIDDTTTDANGYYLFDGLTPGDYQVMFVLVPGLEFSPRDAGANDAVDSDALPTSGMTVCTTLDADENDLKWDAGMYEPEEVLSCRMTGGGNGEAEETNPDRIGNGPNMNVYSCGGQAGAPLASQPQPWGEWTHSQQRGPAGSFTFHGGTASAPRGSEIDWIECNDPGWCVQARKAPAKQLDFGGVGTFHNLKGAPRSISDYVTVGESLHWFEVNIDDLGEPGKAGKQPPAAETCDPLGFGRNGGPELADCGCPDFYRIRIYAGPTDSSIIIYETHGYIEGGNFQIHPPTGRDRKNFDSGGGKSR